MKSAIALFALMSGVAAAQTPEPLRLGVINDQSGIYSDAGGTGTVAAARIAVEEFGGKVLGRPIEIVVGDDQNKPDIAATLARDWIDTQHVTALFDGGGSAAGLAIQQIAREKNKLFLITGSGTTELSNGSCSPVGFQWAWDSYALAAGTVNALTRDGAKSWFFITPDYTFGHVMEGQAAAMVKADGGTVLGNSLHPFGATDYSSFLLQAQASGAQAVALSSSGGDAINAIKQAREFGLMAGKQRIAGMMLTVVEVHSIGLDTAQGLIVTTPFYWDLNERTRAFATRFMKDVNHPPSYLQAGAYSAMLAYLRAVQAAGTTDTERVAAKLRTMRVNDAMTDDGWVRAAGKLMRDMYVMQVKTPAESHGAWDLYKPLYTIPKDQAAMPLSDSKCPLVHKDG
jgi:branched-chain amino acid transport system substrate-binding protein